MFKYIKHPLYVRFNNITFIISKSFHTVLGLFISLYKALHHKYSNTQCCSSEFHLINDPVCPEFNSCNTRGDVTTNGTNNRDTVGNLNTSNITTPNSTPLSSNSISSATHGTANLASAPVSTWAYIHPADKDLKLEVNSKTH